MKPKNKYYCNLEIKLIEYLKMNNKQNKNFKYIKKTI